MTDILLIQPPIRDFYLTAKRTIPYGLASIAAVLVKHGFSVDIFDGLATSKSRNIDLPPALTYLEQYYPKPDRSPFALFNQYRHFGYSFEHIGNQARASEAFLVGISSLFTPYMGEAVQTAEAVKKFHPRCKIVVGGHHATSLPETLLHSKSIDYVLRGEGEAGLPLLAAAIKHERPLVDVPGIAFRRKNGALHINPPAQLPASENYPQPAVHLVKQSFYRRHKKGSAVITASRGCPMRCSYCSLGASSHLPYRRRSVENVMREIKIAVSEHDAGFIDFEDENLSQDRDWFQGLLSEIKSTFGADGPELRAMNGLFPPTLDESMVGAMQAAGFKTLNLSLGTTNLDQLKRFRRPDVAKAFDRSLGYAEQFDMTAVGYVIVGAPFQEPETSISDLLFLAQRRVLAGVSVFYPAPGSSDFDLCREVGILPPDFIRMRSSALPLSHTTNRTEAVTLLRLGRLLNFIKSQIDAGSVVQNFSDWEFKRSETGTRNELGQTLLQSFLNDGRILGMTLDGEIYEHLISEPITQMFRGGLRKIRILGCTSKG